ADGQGRATAGRLPALHHVCRRGEPEAAQHRLHRPLPAAYRRSQDADRRDTARPRRPRAAGKVRYIGCSTLSAWQVVEAQWVSTHLGLQRYVSCQERYSLIDRDLDRDLMPVIESYGLGLIPFSPLADGLLTGKYRRNAPMPAD